jgi:hypothetical protein
MQITVSNPLAAHSLWTTLTSLVDRTVEGCVCGKEGIFPYTLTLFKNVVDDDLSRRDRDDVEHLTINASNASYRVSRIIDVAAGTTSYHAQKKGYVGGVVKRTMGWSNHASIDATDFFAGLIEFAQTFTTPDGAKIRERMAKAEAHSLLANESKATFYKTLADIEARLDLRAFYTQKDGVTDIAQISINRMPNTLPGIYAYASLDGTSALDTIVVKAESGEVASVALVDGKYVMLSSSKKLMDLVQFSNGISGHFVASLVDKTSFVYGLLNTVTVE